MKTAAARTAALAAVVTVIGLLPWLSGKDPALSLLRARSAEQEATRETLAAIREDLGLDTGPLMQLAAWAVGLARGDLGLSWVSGTDVLPSVLSGLKVSLSLMGASLVVALLIASALCAPVVMRGARDGSDGGVGGGTARPAGVRAIWLVIVNSGIRCGLRGVRGPRNEYPASMWR
ncbi:hypothetical protein ACFZCY_38650 [Streptomyces sp. NPDC007983]|uniref:hypothetical protein n=1 Tax=Streptomyces sp. NPDC007983 TaxID=3364800 RepID=UPI0036ED6934